MAPLLDERSGRRWAASEARMIGHGGVSAVAEATGLARRTIRQNEVIVDTLDIAGAIE